jgi:hypothetical protein
MAWVAQVGIIRPVPRGVERTHRESGDRSGTVLRQIFRGQAKAAYTVPSCSPRPAHPQWDRLNFVAADPTLPDLRVRLPRELGDG